MTGPAVLPGGEELREALIAALGAPNSVTEWDVKKGYLDPEEVAQVVLALPEMRDALAAQEKLRRVRERIDAIDADDEPLNIITTAAVRNLLDES